MIGRHTLGTGFHGLLAYLFREGLPDRAGEATLLGGNMSGTTAGALAREFAAFRRLNAKVRYPVFHASLRLPAGETLTDNQWRQAAPAYLSEMGYTDTAYVVVMHPERHIHIVACRVRVDGSRVPAWRDRWRSLEAVAALERQFGLSTPQVRPSPKERSAPVRPTQAERAVRTRDHEALPKRLLANRLEQAITRCDGTRADFTRVLAELKVSTSWNIAQSGRVNGAAYTLVDYAGSLQATLKGSRIGRAYRWQDVAARLGRREQEQVAALAHSHGVSRLVPNPPAGRPDIGTSRGVDRGDLRVPAVGRGVPAPRRLVHEARISLDQQDRWNGHLGVEAVVRMTASHLIHTYPDTGVEMVLAALETARPGSLAVYPRGGAGLAAEIASLVAARGPETMPADQPREYLTR